MTNFLGQRKYAFGAIVTLRVVLDHALPLSLFRLFTFLLDKNGQFNYNIDITELIHSSAGPDHLIAGA